MNHKRKRQIGRNRCHMCKVWKEPKVRGIRDNRLPFNQQRRLPQEAAS